MKILMLSKHEYRETAEYCIDLLNEYSIDYEIMNEADLKISNFIRIQKKLETATHYILFSIKEEYPVKYFFYGYILGCNKPVFVFNELENIDIEIHKKIIFKSKENFKELLQIEIKNWKTQFEKTLALAELKNMNVDITEEALAKCIEEGNKTAVELFFKLDFTTNAKNKKGVPILNIAVRYKHRNIVLFLLSRGADFNKISEDRGNTPLMDAAAEGDELILSDLIQAGSDLNMQSKNGQTALILAIGQNKTQIADILIREGADITLKDKLGMNAKSYANLFKNDYILTILNNLEK